MQILSQKPDPSLCVVYGMTGQPVNQSSVILSHFVQPLLKMESPPARPLQNPIPPFVLWIPQLRAE